MSHNGINATICRATRRRRRSRSTRPSALIDARAETTRRQARRARRKAPGRKQAARRQARQRPSCRPASRKEARAASRRQEGCPQDRRARLPPSDALARRPRSPKYPTSESAFRRMNFIVTTPASSHAVSLHATTSSPSSATHTGKVGMREIARAFGLKNADRADAQAHAARARRRRHGRAAGARSCITPAPCPRSCSPTSPSRDARRRADRRPDRMGRGRTAPPPHIRIHVPRQARPGRNRRRRRPRAAAHRGDRRGEDGDPPQRPRHQGARPRQASVSSASSARCRTAAGGSCRSTRSSSAASSRFRARRRQDAQDGDLVAVERRAARAASGCRPRA